MRINNTELKIIKGDIARIKKDAVVNFVDAKLLKPGSATYKRSAERYAKYVILAAAAKGLETDEIKIRSAVKNSLEIAKRLKLKSIAFTAINCKEKVFSQKAIAKIMSQEVLRHAKYDKEALKEIVFVLDNSAAYKLFKKIAFSYLEYIQHKLCQGPFITVDIIIEVKGGIILIERSNPPFGWAIPGGFVDYGETLEHCAKREAKEETNLNIYGLKQMHTYSDPRRDPRFHTVTTVFAGKAKGKPKAGDDAQNIKVVPLDKVRNLKLAFDHNDVLGDYKKFRRNR